jgi:hypothetical protein
MEQFIQIELFNKIINYLDEEFCTDVVSNTLEMTWELM